VTGNHVPETKKQAKERARKLGFKQSQVVKAPGTSHFYIAPRAVTTTKGKHAFASCREGGGAASTCSAVATNVDKKHRKGRKKK